MKKKQFQVHEVLIMMECDFIVYVFQDYCSSTSYFGVMDKLLKFRHDSFNRDSFMSGVKLAVENVMKVDIFVYGLENIIE